ncbi:Uma2 family endonuclease [Lacipirellula limnantheis]|uniref:Putative restriction endonuclease domain-containing protein n=1 Tax=Lacipirellula limnantheis TaxID=2528024 RepID=A0A517U486_9BACT|nr:Uma2 family endonuclease [Lacipirellula limnantheis]QDT75439.1 hypothetical protein I41_46490 [Lacipirellula limnantheis]
MSSAYSTFVGPPEVGTIRLPVAPLSTEQYLQMLKAGILESSGRVELIEGQITPMAPAGPEHNSSLIRLTRLFVSVLDRYELLIQGTVQIADGQVFEPDLALLELKSGGYRVTLPQPKEVRLVIESAASSLEKDRHVKLPRYAKAGIQEYWLVDLLGESVEVCRKPNCSTYADRRSYAGDQQISPLACPELSVRVGDIFA